MTAGRPTKLTRELLDKANLYVFECKDEIYKTNNGALAYVKVELPSRVGLAVYLDINKDTITQWCKDAADENNIMAQEFSVIVNKIDEEQEKRLLNNGLGGIYSPKMVGMAISRFGYSEKQELDVTSKGEQIGGTNKEADEAAALAYAEVIKKQKT